MTIGDGIAMNINLKLGLFEEPPLFAGEQLCYAAKALCDAAKKLCYGSYYLLYICADSHTYFHN